MTYWFVSYIQYFESGAWGFGHCYYRCSSAKFLLETFTNDQIKNKNCKNIIVINYIKVTKGETKF